jgi:hypothetical protein
LELRRKLKNLISIRALKKFFAALINGRVLAAQCVSLSPTNSFLVLDGDRGASKGARFPIWIWDGQFDRILHPYAFPWADLHSLQDWG